MRGEPSMASQGYSSWMSIALIQGTSLRHLAWMNLMMHLSLMALVVRRDSPHDGDHSLLDELCIRLSS